MSSLNIMVIEDNKIVVLGIKKIYSKHIPDAVITCAENGLQAIDLLSKIKSDDLRR